MDKLVCRVTNRGQVVLPSFTVLLLVVFEGRLEIWLQMRINVTDRQLYEYLQHM
jgi:hypothetical protein